MKKNSFLDFSWKSKKKIFCCDEDSRPLGLRIRAGMRTSLRETPVIRSELIAHFHDHLLPIAIGIEPPALRSNPRRKTAGL